MTMTTTKSSAVVAVKQHISATLIMSTLIFLSASFWDECVVVAGFATIRHSPPTAARRVVLESPVKSILTTFPITTNNNRRQHHRHPLLLYQTNTNDPSKIHPYSLEPNSSPTLIPSCSFTQHQIHQLIAKRLECKRSRNFHHADRILDALNQNGIYIQDKARKYRMDGENHFGRRKHYVQRGGSGGNPSVSEVVDPEHISLMEKLVEERAYWKRRRDYHRSDEITHVLKERYGVRVDDKRREWSFSGSRGSDDPEESNAISGMDDYVPTPLAPKDHPTHTMSPKTSTLIQTLLRKRLMARKRRDYQTADDILEKLRVDYSVLVDDRTREYKVVIGADDLFAREANLSQRSAFVQSQREIPFGGGGERARIDLDGNANDAGWD